MLNLAGVILAGGLSSRMGRDKALLPWQSGETLLEHQFSTLAKVVGADSVYVSGTRPGYNFIPDRNQGRGPIEGVLSVLKHLLRSDSTVGVLILPVDMPFISSEDLKELINGVGKADVSIFAKANLPVFFKNANEALKKIQELDKDEASTFSFRNLYKKLAVEEVHFECHSRLKNLNTLEDWDVAVSTPNYSA